VSSSDRSSAAVPRSHAPGDRDVAVALTFDFDGFSNRIAGFGDLSPGPMSRGEFDRVGVPRILSLLDEYAARATFFTTGHTALAFPELTKDIVAAGHEIGHHGWVHEVPSKLGPQEERGVLVRGCEALEQVSGIRPAGYRSPGWSNSDRTGDLLLELGFEYDSSLMGGDYEPYWYRSGDRPSATEPYVFGELIPLVELPIGYHLDDFVYFEFVMDPVSAIPGLAAPSALLEIWLGEFDYLYEDVGRGLLTLTMHPQVIGRGHRMRMLRSFLDHVTARPGVRFTTCADYARAWRTGHEDPAVLRSEDQHDTSGG
jgi:peptidoglycan/xylan/chitin deacetylase (PgdA/CDA1 family)